MTTLISSSESGVPAPLGRDAADDRLVVLTYNIGGRSAKKAGCNTDMSLADVIGKQSPDIVFLQEARERDCESLADALGMKDFLYIPYRKKGAHRGLV